MPMPRVAITLFTAALLPLVTAAATAAADPEPTNPGVSEPVPAPTPAAQDAPKVSWKDGKTTFESEDVAITLSNRIQLLYAHADAGDASLGAFRLRRAKTKLEGWVYSARVTYELQLNWADTLDPLEDALLDLDALGNGALRLTVGQFKAPFGRQELTSSGKQQFVDRSIVSRYYARGRDVGLQVHGQLAGGRVSYAAGAFNGNGRTANRDRDDRHQWNARLQLAPHGDPKLSESDFESDATPLYALAVGFLRGDQPASTRDRRTVVGVDAACKYRGISLFAEAFLGSVDADPAAPRDAHGTRGFHAQAGYLFADRQWEAAARYGRLDPSDAVSGDETTELGAALSYYYKKHSMKVQADLRRIENRAAAETATEVRVQTQFVF